jgi:hypothetical protein
VQPMAQLIILFFVNSFPTRFIIPEGPCEDGGGVATGSVFEGWDEAFVRGVDVDGSSVEYRGSPSPISAPSRGI